MLQKIEKWRIEELIIILDQLIDLLKKGNNLDWANVFDHFKIEAQYIYNSKDFELDNLKRLIINIKNCFTQGNSLKNPLLFDVHLTYFRDLSNNYLELKSYLLETLDEMESKAIEFIN